jgi:tetratricopeptide (TPR) repeat protein
MDLQISNLLKDSFKLERSRFFAEALDHIVLARRNSPADRSLAIRHGRLAELNKQFPQAEAIYRQLFAQRPESQEPELILGLLRTLVAREQFPQSEALITQLGDRLAKEPDLLVARASCSRHQQQLDHAEAFAAHALELSPDHLPARHELAKVQIARSLHDQAIETLELNICREDLHGDSLDLWLVTLKDLNREIYSQDKLRELVQLFPHRVEFVFGLAVLAHRNGEISVARPAFEQSVLLSPNNPRILHEYGVMERIAGKTSRAQELIEQSLSINPEQPAALRTYGIDHKYVYGDGAFQRLNYASVKLDEMVDEDKVHIHFALGKAFDDVDEVGTAFRHYAIAGAKKLKLYPYPEKQVLAMSKILRQSVTAQHYHSSQQQGCLSQLPVFILGMPRSGTSLMEQILSSHPDIYGAGELKFLTAVLDNIQFGGNRLNLHDSAPYFPYELNASWAERGERFVERISSLTPEPKKRIIDKMPGNFLMLGLIHAILPNARIIHSRRHPVETCLSCYRINFSEGHHWSYGLRELGRYYKYYWELMNFWREQYPNVMLEVRYEDNVADVDAQARKLVDYLGLEWHEGCLEFYNTERVVLTASTSQVRKPIYTTSINRWRKYEAYLGPLLEELGDIVPAYEAEIAHLASA